MAVAQAAEKKTAGERIVKRWVGEEFEIGCNWNDRKNPKLHATSAAAVRETRDHAVENGHVGAREVQVKRTYRTRSTTSQSS